MPRAPRSWLIGLGALGLLCWAHLSQAQPEERVLRWVQEVVLRPASGGERTMTRRWARTPRLSILGGNAAQEKAVTEAVKRLNETLKKTFIKRIVVSPANDSGADIQVIYAPLAKLPAVAKQLRIPSYEEGERSYQWSFWTKKGELTRSYVLLAADKLEGEELRHHALWGAVWALGLQNRSSAYPDSIFAQSDEVQRLSDLDRKLLVFVYNHVPPGSEDTAVAAAYRKYWSKLK